MKWNILIAAITGLLIVSAEGQQIDESRIQTMLISHTSNAYRPERPSEIVDFDTYLALALEVQNYRKNRLVNLDKFTELAAQPNTIILDTRSKEMYDKKHVKGAVHLNFSDFTTENLAAIIPSTATIILIYCNNNFEGDQLHFASKMPTPMPNRSSNKKQVSLALNIPTFINLYGYGYTQIYELESMIHVGNPKIEFEGTAISK
jgi:hypothetical protein